MAYAYKKLTAQDSAVVPFNAHKQYDFTSASAASNQVTYYTSSYTSESVSIYSSASSNTQGVFDSINNIKYNQNDHLFYRDYIKNSSNKKDFVHNLRNRRDLYEKSNILSIPSGLYGFEIKKSSFYLSSSLYEVTDDSYGNLIISGTNVSDYPNDVQENVFRLDPIKGFKKYSLAEYNGYAVVIEGDKVIVPPYGHEHQKTYKAFYRQGTNNTDSPGTYDTARNKYFIGSSSISVNYPKGYEGTQDIDDSYLFNELEYNHVNFKESALGDINHRFPTIEFNSETSSYIRSPHDSRFNFNTYQDFAISFYIKPEITGVAATDKRYIIAKSGTETAISGLISESQVQYQSTLVDKEADAQFPFEVYMISQSLYFDRSDGRITDSINNEITSSGTAERTSHVLCQLSSSVMQIWFDGTKIAEQTTSNLKTSTKNRANLYIGSKGPKATYADGSAYTPKYFNGEIGNINIWSKSYTPTQITNISESVNASPYIGNIFYNSGFTTITHPKYHNILNSTSSIGLYSGSIDTLQFQGSHLMYENEYQCTVLEHEFNNTYNSSTIDQVGTDPYKIDGFTTSSFFKPHVTTIGLYNEMNELLVVGKLGQPVRMSDETDTTFVLRWDT